MSSRRALALSLGLAGWLAGGPALPARADDWSLTKPARPARPATPRVGRPPAERVPGPATPDRRETLIARYLRVLEGDPFDAFAFERLLGLRRERDGALDALARDLAERSAREPDRYTWVALQGRVEAARGERAAARAAFERAAALAPRAAEPWLALAKLAAEAGEHEAAGAAFEGALERAGTGAARREILTASAEHALDRGDWEGAEQRFEALWGDGAGGAFGATAFARALRERGEHVRAVAAFERALDRLRGDARVQNPVRVDLARAQLDAGQLDAAIATLDAAARATAGGSGTAREIDELRVEAHRRRGTLRALVDALRARARDVEGMLLVGRIHDELGEHEAALEAFRGVLARAPRHVDARVRVIRLLSREGRLDEVVREYRALVRAAPREPRFVIELAEVLVQTGDRAEALAILAEVGRRNPREARVHRALAELYAGWGEHALATSAIEHLSRIEPNDLAHWVTLGEQYLVRGDRERALATWRRIPRIGGGRADAYATLGGVYRDHDMLAPAIEAYEQAVGLDPTSVEHSRDLADALETANRDADALARWERVLVLAGEDRVLRREARRRIVRLWLQTGVMHGKVSALERAFGWSPSGGELTPNGPPDLDAGRFLAEAYQVLARGRHGRGAEPRYLRAAEEALARTIAAEPGDVESLLSLQRLRERRGDVEGAIATLERLLQADPARARGYLAQMAQHSLALYRDDDAVKYAEHAVALGTDDAAAHVRLGDLYRARHDVDAAIGSYTRALELDATLDRVQFALAELLLSQGDAARAQEMLTAVVRSSPDDEVVKRAARWATQLALADDRLEALEHALLGLALAVPGRPVYRRMLVELYDAAMQGRAAEVVSGSGPEAARVGASLGRGAIKPLLEALADPDPSQRRVAVAVLARLEDPNAALPLVVAAEADGDVALRREALLAAGALEPEALAARIAAFAEMPEQRLRDAGAWALARLRGPAAVAALRRLAEGTDPRVRGYALLGLARADERSALEIARRHLLEDPHAWVRASAALALGRLGDRSARAALAASLRAERPGVAASAALALGRLRDPEAAAPLAEALFSTDPVLQQAALRALWWLGSRTSPPEEQALPDPDAGDDVALLHALTLVGAPDDADASLAAAMPSLAAAGRLALAGPGVSVQGALRLLEGTRPSLLPAPEPAMRAARELAASLRDELVALVDHPEPAVRVGAVRLLPRLGRAASSDDLVRALEDREPVVRGAALEAAAEEAAGGLAADRVASIARGDPRWWMRLRAVRALGRERARDAEPVLVEVLRGDAYAYVREAAAVALGRLGGGRDALREAQLRDPEPRVRVAAERALREAARGRPPAGTAH